MAERYLTYPFRIYADGRLSTSQGDAYLRELIEQILFTNPGERVNLPEFGCGLNQLVFRGNSESLADRTKFVITQNVTSWLGDLIVVDDVIVTPDDGVLNIEIVYTRKETQSKSSASFSVVT